MIYFTARPGIIVYYYTSFIHELIVTRVGWGTTNAVRSASTESCHSASEKSSVTYNFFYFGRIDLIKTRKSNYEII
jgi:hypothetical protein